MSLWYLIGHTIWFFSIRLNLAASEAIWNHLMQSSLEKLDYDKRRLLAQSICITGDPL